MTTPLGPSEGAGGGSGERPVTDERLSLVLSGVLGAYATDPCTDCGQPLGDFWKERYDQTNDRLVKVHSREDDCA